MAALAFAVLLVLSGCTAQPGSQSPSGPDSSSTSTSSASAAGEGGGTGWKVFRAAAHQWQVGFSLAQVGPPWAQGTPLVSHLAPGAETPVYEGELPVNTLIAPARPTTVHPAGAFGWRVAPDIGVRELHNGADIGAVDKSAVVAAMDGVVRGVFWNVWGGNRVEVAHVGGMVTTYNHLDEASVKKGDALEASQRLGSVGATGARVTGPHLHFETWVDGEAVDPQSFDWIDQGRVIPAPRKPGQEVRQIPSGGPGDESSLEGAEDCPYPEDHDIECSAPDAVNKQERCLTGAGDGSCPDDAASELERCLLLGMSRRDCTLAGKGGGPKPTTDPTHGPTAQPTADPTSEPSTGPTTGPGDCTGAQRGAPGCPVWPPPLEQCQDLGGGAFDCEPFGTTGPEDCPAAAEGGRTDCPVWPPPLEQCQDLGGGAFDCEPFGTTGPEDCPAAAEGGRTDCPPLETISDATSMSGGGGDVAAQRAGRVR